MTMQHLSSNLEFANQTGAVLREIVELAFRRLRVNQTVTPDEIERTMLLIDSGALDEAIERVAPPPDPAAPERYEDVVPFSHEAWKARHGIKD